MKIEQNCNRIDKRLRFFLHFSFNCILGNKNVELLLKEKKNKIKKGKIMKRGKNKEGITTKVRKNKLKSEWIKREKKNEQPEKEAKKETEKEDELRKKER